MNFKVDIWKIHDKIHYILLQEAFLEKLAENTSPLFFYVWVSFRSFLGDPAKQ